MSREGEARRPALLEPPKRSPRPSFLPIMSLLAAVCRVCLPSAAAPRPRPLRCGLLIKRARRVKAAQEGELKGGGALALALTAVLGLRSRTEAGRKKGSKGLDFGLYIIRDIADRGEIGLVLLGMPGLDKRLQRVPQLYSRIGFAHEIALLPHQETRFFLEQRWGHRVSAHSEDFTDQEAVATIIRITQGNMRLIDRLMKQVERVLTANQLTVVTKEVVETARKNLIIGFE